MEKLLIIFPAWQQHHNIKENLKCTNFYSIAKNTSEILNQCQIFKILNQNIKPNMRNIKSMSNIGPGSMADEWRQLGGVDTLCTVHTPHVKHQKLTDGDRKHIWNIIINTNNKHI